MSFSIHQIAEYKRKKVSLQEINDHYDDLEKTMLDNFYKYVRNQPNARWLHWNMRDANYGFEAIAHRYRVLSGDPVDIPTSHLFDLAAALGDIYGRTYVSHREKGRLESLMDLNQVTSAGFLSGKEEAKAFDNREFVKLHQSTLRKVRVIRRLASLEWDRTLTVEVGWWQRNGASFAGVVELVTGHWGYKLAGGVAMAGGLVVLALRLF